MIPTMMLLDRAWPDVSEALKNAYVPSRSTACSTAMAMLIASLIAATSLSAAAYDYFPSPFGPNEASKWGSNVIGTPGGIVTWSLMPDGTALDPLVAPLGFSGTSNLTGVFDRVGGRLAALYQIQAALDGWAAVADVQFQYVGNDDGTPFGAAYSPGQQIGHLRLGAFEFPAGSFSAAVGYAAPPNGFTTLEGDILLNTRADIAYYVAPEAEGQLYDLYPPGGGLYRNDFQGLIAHEVGHTLGLAHSDVPTGLMCGYVDAAFDGSACYWADPDFDGRAPVTRLPRPDDVAGIQFLYGPSQVPEPGLASMLAAGLSGIALAARARGRTRRPERRPCQANALARCALGRSALSGERARRRPRGRAGPGPSAAPTKAREPS
ncbi:MAG: matrixin family metalloprotease [Deltaproteobacteria bacterium]|nr:matrixin family metalloprotease [Deltaproteobacteria bacterium]